MKKFDRVIDNLIGYSFKLKKGDQVVVEGSGKETFKFCKYFAKKCEESGINCVVWAKSKQAVVKFWNSVGTNELEEKIKNDLNTLKQSKAYLRVSGFSIDKVKLSEIGQNNFRKRYFKAVHSDYRVNKMEWCILGFPSRENAKEAHMNINKYAKFVLNVVSLNYAKMNKSMENLKKLMEKTDIVKIVSKETNLTFSIKDQPAVKCAGEKNLPDGEIYCGPIRKSVNGFITYNAKSSQAGSEFKKIRFDIKNGKIVEAFAETDELTIKLNKILDIDKNARFFGEFAIGVNPYIEHAVGNTLFDEKITGSIHFTPGSCYDDSSNGNESALHWDLVLILREEFGGGEIWFDNKLIQKNGIFIPKNLHCLNKENLI